MLLELIIINMLGLIFIYLGLIIWKKEKISIIHSYHYKKVKECDRKAYTEMMGKGILIMGIGMLFTGIVDYITKTTNGWFLFAAFSIVGVLIMLRAQKKYNNGVF